jgi:hypothetical protein
MDWIQSFVIVHCVHSFDLCCPGIGSINLQLPLNWWPEFKFGGGKDTGIEKIQVSGSYTMHMPLR